MKGKFIIFSDFDGTITKCDILDGIITDIFSFEKYKEVENKLLNGELIYEKYLFDMFHNITYDITKISTNLVDENFYNFYDWVSQNNINFYIISSGFIRIIEHLLPYVNKKKIFGNEINIDDNNIWKVELYDKVNNSSINKNDIIDQYKKTDHKTVFIGDGLSDFKVIGNVDILFCKKDSLLHEKCVTENTDCIVFENFKDILSYFQKL